VKPTSSYTQIRFDGPLRLTVEDLAYPAYMVNRLRLNIGIDEGQEWFGTYQTPTHVEVTALGETINRASRLSDFATDGTAW
jgi:class 3 adenylate cyclase